MFCSFAASPPVCSLGKVLAALVKLDRDPSCSFLGGVFTSTLKLLETNCLIDLTAGPSK